MIKVEFSCDIDGCPQRSVVEAGSPMPAGWVRLKHNRLITDVKHACNFEHASAMVDMLLKDGAAFIDIEVIDRVTEQTERDRR